MASKYAHVPKTVLGPDKRGNRPSEVLLHISGKATYQELAPIHDKKERCV
jgi:hypothetical protein